MNEPTPPIEWWTLEQVAQKLSVHRNTARRILARQKLKAWNPSGRKNAKGKRWLSLDVHKMMIALTSGGAK